MEVILILPGLPLEALPLSFEALNLGSLLLFLFLFFVALGVEPCASYILDKHPSTQPHSLSLGYFLLGQESH